MRSPEWLRRDARNRVARTILQGVVAVVVLPAGDAAVQVLRREMTGHITGGTAFDWHRVGVTAAMAAGTAVLMAVAAYLHRVRLDPSPLPSAAPPWPTGRSRPVEGAGHDIP